MAAGPVSVARRQLRCHEPGAEGRRAAGYDAALVRCLNCGNEVELRVERRPEWTLVRLHHSPAQGPLIDPNTAATTAPCAAVRRLEIQPGEHDPAGIILLPYGAQPG